MPPTVQQIFRQNFSALAAGRRLPLHYHKAAQQFIRCRTAALGGHVQACPEGHIERVWYNSCRHRTCPQCNQIQVERWLAAQRARLLDCAHHHIIFTLPHELNPLWQYNRAALMSHLFQAVREVLMELLADPKYLGAEPGFLLALHTWGRSLSLHPHIHCLITDGGLAGDEWRTPRGSCFLPARVVMAKFRGTFLWMIRDALEKGELTLPRNERPARFQSLLNRLGRIKWNVHLRERYGHGAGVVQYLARYVRGGPLRNSQLIDLSSAQVKFRYFAHNDGAARVMTLTPEVFMLRYLQHVPEAGRPTVRHYGLYAHTKTAALNRARPLFQQPPLSPALPLTWQAYYQQRHPEAGVHTCAICGVPLVNSHRLARSRGPPPGGDRPRRPAHA